MGSEERRAMTIPARPCMVAWERAHINVDKPGGAGCLLQHGIQRCGLVQAVVHEADQQIIWHPCKVPLSRH